MFHLLKTTCLQSNHLILVVQTKIWEPFLWSSIFNEYDLRHHVLPAGDLMFLTSPSAWTCWQCCYGMWITLTFGFWNYSLEWGTLMTKYFLSSTQNTNAFCCFWNSVDNQLKGNVGQGLIIYWRTQWGVRLTWLSGSSCRGSWQLQSLISMNLTKHKVHQWNSSCCSI